MSDVGYIMHKSENFYQEAIRRPSISTVIVPHTRAGRHS